MLLNTESRRDYNIMVALNGPDDQNARPLKIVTTAILRSAANIGDTGGHTYYGKTTQLYLEHPSLRPDVVTAITESVGLVHFFAHLRHGAGELSQHPKRDQLFDEPLEAMVGLATDLLEKAARQRNIEAFDHYKYTVSDVSYAIEVYLDKILAWHHRMASEKHTPQAAPRRPATFLKAGSKQAS